MSISPQTQPQTQTQTPTLDRAYFLDVSTSSAREAVWLALFGMSNPQPDSLVRSTRPALSRQVNIAVNVPAIDQRNDDDQSNGQEGN